MWAGYCVSLEIEEILFQEKSKYQDILIFKRLVMVMGFYSNAFQLDRFIFSGHVPVDGLAPLYPFTERTVN